MTDGWIEVTEEMTGNHDDLEHVQREELSLEEGHFVKGRERKKMGSDIHLCVGWVEGGKDWFL